MGYNWTLSGSCKALALLYPLSSILYPLSSILFLVPTHITIILTTPFYFYDMLNPLQSFAFGSGSTEKGTLWPTQTWAVWVPVERGGSATLHTLQHLLLLPVQRESHAPDASRGMCICQLDKGGEAIAEGAACCA